MRNLADTLSDTDRRLLNDYQRGLPLGPRPFAQLAANLGLSERQVIERLQFLQEQGIVSRVGPVFRPNRIGVSTLAALAVPPQRLDEVAARVSAFAEVNHNYEREHEYNLWFVLTAPTAERLQQVLCEIATATGFEPLDLPMLEDYHIDLGFHLQWT